MKKVSVRPSRHRKSLCPRPFDRELIICRCRGLDRATVFLTTKVQGREHGYDACAKAVDSSFKRLGGAWDLILLHDPTSGKQRRIDAYRALGSSVRIYAASVVADHCAHRLQPTP